MHLATLANIVLVVAVVSAALWFFRRARRVSSTVRGGIAEKEGPSWSGLVAGIAFTAYGVAATVTGKADVDLVQVEGTNVRIAGALISVVGVVLAALAFRRR